MCDLDKIDLGNDEAEQDERLKEYFLKTRNYENALLGTKSIIIGRKGSGKSAIFTLLEDELEESGVLVIPITPDQYSWNALRDYRESGIQELQAYTNAWKITLLSAVVCKLNDAKLVSKSSELVEYYKYMKDAYIPSKDTSFLTDNIIDKIKPLLKGIKTQWIWIESGSSEISPTPIRIIEEIKKILIRDWPNEKKVRILIDRLDDSWDASDKSKNMIIGLLKASNDVNASFGGKIIITVFLRSDIYDNLFFDDKDKLRQYEETLIWNRDNLKAVVAERVRVSLKLDETNPDKIWKRVFSEEIYRSKASPEKYIIDRTFKRPRDIISFVRFAIEVAIQNGHCKIMRDDTRLAEERYYSHSKYDDLIIEYQKQFPKIKQLLDSFSGSRHELSRDDLLDRINGFIEKYEVREQNENLLRQLFVWGVIGVKRQGRAGLKQRGGTGFYYYYDDPSINPHAYKEYYIHPSLRHHLNISEKREKISRNMQESDIDDFILLELEQNALKMARKYGGMLPLEIYCNETGKDRDLAIKDMNLLKDKCGWIRQETSKSPNFIVFKPPKEAL